MAYRHWITIRRLILPLSQLPLTTCSSPSKPCERGDLYLNYRRCVAGTVGHLYVNARAPCTRKSIKQLLQKDLIEDCLRKQGLLVQTMLANQELLFRREAFLGPMGAQMEGIKGTCSVVQKACCGGSLTLCH